MTTDMSPGTVRARRTPRLCAVLAPLAVLAVFGGLAQPAESGPSSAPYAVLHHFQSGPGAARFALVADGDGNVFGTTEKGGASDGGTIFKMKTDGTGFQVLHEFRGGATDGKMPQAALTIDNAGNLYGTTYLGGQAAGTGGGTVFTIRTDGSGFELLHVFSGSDAIGPGAALALKSGMLYGTTYWIGALFAVRIDGTGFRILHRFTGGTTDGESPQGPVTADDAGNLYGTTVLGGSYRNSYPGSGGTLFTIKTDGTGYQILHSFNPPVDGNNPSCLLLLDGAGHIYGNTFVGGNGSAVFGPGTIFRANVDGTDFQVIHTFSNATADPKYPGAAMVLDTATGTLYGSTFGGGSTACQDGCGGIFSIATNGTGLTILHTFVSATEGSHALAGLVLAGSDDLVGITRDTGPFNGGAIFKIGKAGTGFQVLRAFPASGGDGSRPFPSALLALTASGDLVGTTTGGGAASLGTIFKMKADGTGFQVLHSFVEAEGWGPWGGVTLDGAGNIYGTANLGGHGCSLGCGTVFAMNDDGSNYRVLHAFSNTDGSGPRASLWYDGSSFLYGTTEGGGTSSKGTVFRVRTDGTDFQVLHSFAGGPSDGSYLRARLIPDGTGYLYGTTYQGGASDAGTVFRIKTDGSGFALLHSFASDGSEGKWLESELVLGPSSTLYGIAAYGSSCGAVFKLQTDGSGFQVVKSLTCPIETGPRYPSGGLALDASGNLYGATMQGGIADGPTVFTLKTDGTGFQVLHAFEGTPRDGSGNVSSPILDSAGTLYGTTRDGGSAGFGIVFRMPPAPTPRVASFSPIKGGAGTSVQITGTGFTGATAAVFNGVVTTALTVNSDTLVTALVPAGASSGPVGVTTPNGTGSSIWSFLMNPAVAGFSPASGTPGTTVKIVGMDLDGTTAVAFNGTAAASFTVHAVTSISAVVPPGASTGPIRVTTWTGTGASSAAFTIVPIARPTFTDDPLAARGTAVKAAHVIELRQAVNDLRTRYGLLAAVWTDATLTERASVVKAVHLQELRTRLNEAYAAISRNVPSYTHATLSAGTTTIAAADVTELRAAVLAIW